MLRLLHLVNDTKFIDRQLQRYLAPGFYNDVVYLDNKFNYKGVFSDTIKWVIPESDDFTYLIAEAKKYNAVFVYFLDYNKARYINQIDKSIVVIWQFYGGEIYHSYKYSHDYYAPKTKAILKKGRYINYIKKSAIEAIAMIQEKVLGKNSITREINRAIKRSNYFLWYDIEEYNHIKSKVYYLPKFLQLPITNRMPELSLNKKKELKIMIGNSMAPTNNHYDALLFLEDAGFKHKAVLPFSYSGGKSEYLTKLKQLSEYVSYEVEYIEEFLPYLEYTKLICSCTAAVLYSYRQMGLGNVLILINNGVKLYLSEKNPSYYWLKSQGFYVFSIEKELKADIKKDNILMTQDQSIHNRLKYTSLVDPKHFRKFVNELKMLCNVSLNECNA